MWLSMFPTAAWCTVPVLALFSWPAAAFTRWNIRAPFPVLAIDHVYAGAAWRTVSVRRGPRLGSDHYPVVVVLARDAP